MNPKFSDVFSLVAGAAVILGGAWWMMNRRAAAATVPAGTSAARNGAAASSDAWFDQWYYAGKPLAIDARDTWAASAGLTPAKVNGVSQAELNRENPWLLAGL